MINITAEKLRSISESSEANLEVVLNRMKATAESGERVYHHYDRLSSNQITHLTKLGFGVVMMEDKDGDFYKITW